MLMRQDVNNEVRRDLSIKMIVTSLFLQVRYNDLAYYQHENITDPNGPAMTHSMFTIGWLEAGEQEQAERAFIKNFANIQGPFKVRNSFPLFFLVWQIKRVEKWFFESWPYLSKKSYFYMIVINLFHEKFSCYICPPTQYPSFFWN